MASSSNNNNNNNNTGSAIRIDPETGEVKTVRMTGKVVAANVAAGLFGPLLAAPFIAIVDGSIINSVNGDKTPVWQGIKSGYKMLFMSPMQFMRKEWYLCGLCWMVYSGTYACTNNVRSYCEANELSKDVTDTWKFTVSLVVNVGLTQVKDALMVNYFASRGLAQSGGKGSTSVPMKTRGLFFVRDALTMYAAFCLGDRLADWMYSCKGNTLSKQTCSLASNFVTPAALQPLSTVAHLWALENAAAVAAQKPTALSGLLPSIRQKYLISTASRIGRIVPAVSFGNNVNNVARGKLLSQMAL